MTAPDADSPIPSTAPVADSGGARMIAAVLGAGLLVVLPLASGVRLPLGLSGGDLGLRLGMLVGTLLGAGVYWSLPRRSGRQRRRRSMQLISTLGSAWFGGVLLSAATLFLTDEPVFGGELAHTALYGLWCATAITVASLFIRHPGRRRISRSRRGRTGTTAGSPATAIEPLVRTPRPISSPSRSERECPWCAERILVRARVCKFCGHDVDPLNG